MQLLATSKSREGRLKPLQHGCHEHFGAMLPEKCLNLIQRSQLTICKCAGKCRTRRYGCRSGELHTDNGRRRPYLILPVRQSRHCDGESYAFALFVAYFDHFQDGDQTVNFGVKTIKTLLKDLTPCYIRSQSK